MILVLLRYFLILVHHMLMILWEIGVINSSVLVIALKIAWLKL